LQSFNICNSLFLSLSLCKKPCPCTVASDILPLTNSLSHLLMLAVPIWFIHTQTISQSSHIFCVPHVSLYNFQFFLARTSISSPTLPLILSLIHAHNHYCTQRLWFPSVIYAYYSSYISMCYFLFPLSHSSTFLYHTSPTL
jgi:hypothetical protein